MSKYTITIASLKATTADIQQLDAKNVLLNGKDISDHVSDAIADNKTDIIDQVNETIDETKTDLLNTIDGTKTDILDQVNETIDENKIVVLDERGTLANDALDIWNSSVTKDANNNVIINTKAKPFKHWSLSSEEQSSIVRSAVKIIDNKVLGPNDEHLMYWQTGGLVEGIMLFYEFTNLTSFSSSLYNIIDGECMFSYCSNLTSFSSDLPNLKRGSCMFWECSNLTSFSADLSNMTDGGYMFDNCTNLTSFSSDLSSLTDGLYMFRGCNLTLFSFDLPNLTNGSTMFYGCSNLISFSSDLPNLTDGGYMFLNCVNLTSFSSDLSSLTDGVCMFLGCTNLTSFSSCLSNLTRGGYMFLNCKLDAPSVANIIHFIPQRESKPTSTTDNGNITIGLGITNTDEAKQTFAKECDCDSWIALNNEFNDKNWTVVWQLNGEDTTFDIRSERPSTAVYTKLEEVIVPTEEEIAAAKKKREHIQIPHYQYTSQDGSKFYNVHWYHDSNTNNEGYDHFESLEEAMSAYNVIPKA